MNIKIRQESQKDFLKVEKIIVEAFLNAEFSSGKEQELVNDLRLRKEFISSLSLVAEVDGEIAGHILLTPVTIKSPEGSTHPTLALAPVSVAPKFQGKGLGGELILQSHKDALSNGFGSIILLGHPDYYPRFGYKRASEFGIKAPFDVPDEAFMAIELIGSSLAGISGNVIYPEAFSSC